MILLLNLAHFIELYSWGDEMTYLRRKIDKLLFDWKQDKDRKPLIVKGARQIGKTESILRFAKDNYDNYIYINFVEEPKYRRILDNGYAVNDIIKNISLIDPNKIFSKSGTLIIFFFFLAFPDITTSLKFFCIDDRFDVICNGSLLGISYQQIESNSVGYKTDIEMCSLDFEEFLWAKGHDEKMIDDIYDHIRNQKPFSQLEMSLYTELFIDYCVLGGMPAVVRTYIEKGTF